MYTTGQSWMTMKIIYLHLSAWHYRERVWYHPIWSAQEILCGFIILGANQTKEVGMGLRGVCVS